jgi:hypothetical protein
MSGRLEELKSMEVLSEDECIEYLMLSENLDRETAEEWFDEFASEHEPVFFQ